MAKFVIECPNCGKYAQAKTGVFARRKINCSCGYTIQVRTDRLSTRVCPHCGNTFVYDAADGKKISCPVCRKKVISSNRDTKLAAFHCEQCGVRLETTRNAETYTCPVCDHVNDVQKRLMGERLKREGLASIIKYEGDANTLIWKHPIEDFNLGSQLIVHESQEAVFFRDGQALDLFGAGRYTLETQQIPMLEKLYQLPTNGERTFHSEVYFINKSVQMALKWGTPEKIRFIDPLTGVPLALGASGEMNLQVSDARRLLVKLVGTGKMTAWEDGAGASGSLQMAFRPLIANAVKSNLAAVIKSEAINLLEIDEKLDVLSEALRQKLLPGFEEYGLSVRQFFVNRVVLPEEDPNFQRIRELHTITLQTRVLQADALVKTVQAQSETQYRTAQEQSRAAIEAARREAELQQQMTQTEIARREAERKVIAAQAEAQALRLTGLTDAEIMKAKGYDQRDVLRTEVQKAYAESIGEMGPAITTGGSSGSGILGDMLGLGVGMAAVGAVAPQIGDMMQSFRQAAPEAQAPGDGWVCPQCGAMNHAAKFCPECGAKRPEAKPAGIWNCMQCGHTGITSKFCPECGAKKPDESWNCPACGEMNIKSNFCPNCGHKK